MIKIENAVKKYKNRIVLDDVSIEFQKGKAYGIVGTNGSGKTVLLKAICGFIVLDKGVIYQDNIQIRNKYNLIENAGIVFNEFSMIPHKSILDNLIEISKINNKIGKEGIENLLEAFNMSKHINDLYSNVSLGTKKKALIIQAIMDRPDVLILDEPFNALDERTSLLFKKYLINFKKTGLIIITSHNSSDIKEICDEVVKIEEGAISNGK